MSFQMVTDSTKIPPPFPPPHNFFIWESINLFCNTAIVNMLALRTIGLCATTPLCMAAWKQPQAIQKWMSMATDNGEFHLSPVILENRKGKDTPHHPHHCCLLGNGLLQRSTFACDLDKTQGCPHVYLWHSQAQTLQIPIFCLINN